MKIELPLLKTDQPNYWCPGCGDFGVLSAVKQAISSLDLHFEDVVLVVGIGCFGKISNYMNTNSFKVIHGRVLPVSIGIKVANPKLTVIGHSGDGDGYAIGMGHLPHAIRKNINMTLIVHDNGVYGLTTGQTSPTSVKGYLSKTTPFGNLEEPINPIALAIATGATFVARIYPSGGKKNVEHAVNILKQAIQHRGFALVDVLQVCKTFNKFNTYDYYNQRVYHLEETGYEPNDRVMAFQKALEWGDEATPDNGIPIGIFYREEKPTFEEQIPQLQEAGPPALQPIDDIQVAKVAARFR